ncbi:MAG: hypothetical protein AB7N24_02110 [Dehalococcoidia bacterium]
MNEILAVIGALAIGAGAPLWNFESTWARPALAARLGLDLGRLRTTGRAMAVILLLSGIVTVLIAMA